jgi:hypothetical protein
MASFIVYGDASGQVTVAAPAAAGTNTITVPAETGTLITSAYTGAALPGQIAWDTTVKTSGFTAVAYGGYFCNTTSAAFTVTLPATPARGDFVVIVDYAGTSATNNITVSPNGGNINGTTGNAALKTNRQGITFTYIDATQGWLASSNVYGGVTPFTQPYTASYLIVAGGGSGAGGQGGAGGAGAGGYLAGTTTLSVGTVYTFVVGGGAAVPAGSAQGTTGSNSTGFGLTANGGGGGGAFNTPTGGSSGGSGGGGGTPGPGTFYVGGAGTPGQGNTGGTATTNYSGGGGGGSGGVGGGGNVPASTAGSGGLGTASSITGSSVTYGGGGGGGTQTPSAPASAKGGPGTPGISGGNGGFGATAGTAGIVNTGGGGGAGGGNPASSAAGGSGVVIISVPTANYTGTTTGSPTVTTSGSNTIIKYTSGSGTYTA